LKKRKKGDKNPKKEYVSPAGTAEPRSKKAKGLPPWLKKKGKK